MSGPVVVLAGGTGGAKLARGMLDVVGPDQLVVIANTGDDVEIYGAYVSPDPDLVTFWLADRIDERGWGLANDTFAVMDGLRELGVEVWFNLGDRDLAVGIERARALDEGARLTDAQAAITSALQVRARVLPMTDQPGAHPRHGERPLVAVSGVHDQAGRSRAGAGRRLPRSARGTADPRGSGGDRHRARDRDRPLQSGHLDRADPRRSPVSAPRCATVPRRWSPSAHSCTAPS